MGPLRYWLSRTTDGDRSVLATMSTSVLIICIGLSTFAGAQSNRPNSLNADALKNTPNRPISIVYVKGVAGQNISLPCDIKPRDGRDAISVVLWFKGGSNAPVFRYDARNQQAKRATNTMHFSSNRAHFEASPPAHLYVQNLTESDEGEYRCRVDFRDSPTQNLKVNLSVTVPPSMPKIYDAKKRQVSKHLEAYPEGADLELVCEVYGGKPPPRVRWYVGSDLVDAQYNPDYVVTTSERHDESNQPVIIKHIVMRNLQRGNNHNKLICEASNTNLTQPLKATVYIRMNLKPLNVSISNKKAIVNTKKRYTSECRSVGSSPPANLTWYIGARELQTNETKFKRNNGTLSVLHWTPSPDDDGKYLTCRAENQHLPEATIEDKWKLVVHFMPIVTLKMGATVNQSYIKEGDNVYLDCAVRANPPMVNLTWYHKGKELHHNVSAGVVLSGQSLLLSGITRKVTGNYTCASANTEGRNVSNAVYLNVKYAPVCKQVVSTKNWTHRNESLNLVCLVDANPTFVNFRWTFNKSGDVSEIPSSAFTNEGTKSKLTFTLPNDVDSGVFDCWANNLLGHVKEPCQYQVITSVGKPYPLRNCTAHNRNESWIRISCIEGFDGGSPQKFVAMVNKQRLVSTNPYWEFEVRQPTTIALYAENLKGPSQPVIINDITLNTTPKSQVAEDAGFFINMSPILIGLGVTAAILGLIVIGVLMALWRRHVTTPAKPPQQPILTTFPGKCEEEEGNPDLIPTTVLINHETATVVSESSRKNTIKSEMT